jgi:hypothetical protein
MRSKWLGARASALALIAAVAALVMPGAAMAAKPTATTGGAANVTFQSARVNGSVDANSEATNYYFQYGTSRAYGTETAMTPAGARANPVRVSVDLGGLAPATRYHYRIVARNGSGTALGGDRAFTTRRQPLGVSLAASPNPIKVGVGTTLAGTLSGTGNANRKVVLQSNPWPYTQGFRPAANEQVTNAQGGFSFPQLSVPFNTQYRVQMPERPQVVSPIVTVQVKQHISTTVSKHRVRRGRRIRFSGRVSPARVGASIAFQKKRGGTWVTVGGTIVHTGGRYARRVRIRRGGTFRVWTGVADQQYTSTAGRSVHLRTFR